MTTRKEFEKYAKASGLDLEIATYGGHELGQYRYIAVESAWQAWQAAKRLYKPRARRNVEEAA